MTRWNDGNGRPGAVVAMMLALSLAACGGGGSDGGVADDSGDDGRGDVAGDVDPSGVASPGVVEDAPGSSLAEGEPPDVPLSAAAARAFAVDVAELNDALHFLAVILPSEIALADGACEGGGTRAVSDEGDGRRVTFADCALSGNAAVRLDGTAAIGADETEADAERLVLDVLAIRSAGRRVAASGALRLAPDGNTRRVTLASESLDVDDSQGELVLTALDVAVPDAGDAGEARIAYAVDSTRAGESAAVSGGDALVFDGTLGCPTGGTLELRFDDDRALVLTGAPGGNLGLGGDFGDDTLGCDEIGRLVPASGFQPPPIPGN